MLVNDLFFWDAIFSFKILVTCSNHLTEQGPVRIIRIGKTWTGRGVPCCFPVTEFVVKVIYLEINFNLSFQNRLTSTVIQIC